MSGEKTEQPTEQKLEKSAEKGQVSQRKNVAETGTIIFATIYVSSTWRTLVDSSRTLFDSVFMSFEETFVERIAVVQPLAVDVINYALYFTVSSGVFGLFFTLFLNKFNFAPKAMAPKFEKFNPVTGLKQIFCMNTLYNFIRLLILFTCAVLILYLVISLNLRAGIAASYCGLPCLSEFFPPLFLQLVAGLIALSVILAAFDYRIQNALYLKQNKMSKSDVKRENHDSEGNPMIKGRRSSLAHEDAQNPGIQDVTHVVYSSDALVAISFDKQDPDLPPFVIMKVRGKQVVEKLKYFKSRRVKCINSASIAVRFYQNTQVNNYVMSAASMDAATILNLAGELK